MGGGLGAFWGQGGFGLSWGTLGFWGLSGFRSWRLGASRGAGLVDPADHFKSGKHEGKFGAFDKGVPTQMADGTEIPEKKLKALKKEYDSVKDKWDKHQQAMAKYSQDLTKYEKPPGRCWKSLFILVVSMVLRS